MATMAQTQQELQDEPASAPCASVVRTDGLKGADGAGDESFEAWDEEYLQSLMQPAISPLATRLSSPNTPAAEKAAAMDRIPGGGLFEISPSKVLSRLHASTLPPPSQNTSTMPQRRSMALGKLPSRSPENQGLPTPWQSGPKNWVMEDESPSRPRLALIGAKRPEGAMSLVEGLWKKLSKALPSIAIPAGFLQSLASPPFLSFTSPPKNGCQVRATKLADSASQASERDALRPLPSKTRPETPSPRNTPGPGAGRPSSVTSKRCYFLRRPESEESLLYQSLSRASSHGDEARFAHVHEQVNSRLKALMDSFDSPSLKLPNIPSWKEFKAPTGSTDTSKVAAGPRQDKLHPLDAVLETLTGDLVILGGYRGSILRSAQPPHRQLWAPVKLGLNIRKVSLEVGLDPEDEATMEQHVFASGMLKHIGPVDIARRLFKKLGDSDNVRNGTLRVHDYGYDWRLSPQLLSRKVVAFLEKLPSNQADAAHRQGGALVIAHSLGGLIARHAVNQRPDLFSGVVFAGTPQRCINILGPLRNGDAVLLNEKVLTAQVNFSLRTSFVFLPEDGHCFIDKTTGEAYPVDFYSVADWIKYRLSPCVGEPVLPSISSARTSNGLVGSIRSLPDSFASNLSLRVRSNSHSKKEGDKAQPGMHMVLPDGGRNVQREVRSNRSMAPPPLVHQARQLDYLGRTLAQTLEFRAELAHNPSHQSRNSYPPFSVIYSRDTPTVYAARVASRDAIATTEAYEDLAFRGGDGVVLASAAMLPKEYSLARNGKVRTDRGHVTLLGDLAAVGKAIEAVVRGRAKGIGMGPAGTKMA